MTREYHMLSSPASHRHTTRTICLYTLWPVAAVLRAIHVHKNTWPDIVNVVLNMHVRIFSWTLLFQFWIVKSEDRIVRKTTSDLPCFQLCFLILYPKRSVSKCRLTRRNYLIVKSNKNHMSWYVKCIWILKICDLLKTLFWLASNKPSTYFRRRWHAWEIRLPPSWRRSIGGGGTFKVMEVEGSDDFHWRFI